MAYAYINTSNEEGMDDSLLDITFVSSPVLAGVVFNDEFKLNKIGKLELPHHLKV